MRPGRTVDRVARPLALALLLAACATVRVPDVEPPPGDRAIQAWARVLRTFVNNRGQVAFERLAADRRDLDRYVAYVARVDPARDREAFPTSEAQMAHHLNAYNALSMYGVLEAGLPETNAGLRKVRFFYLRRYRIAGRVESLYTYEKRIRALGDERVHFALNCMSVSCPRLPQEPFRGAELEAQLAASTREFFSSPAHLRVDDAARRMEVSSILKFYRSEFLRAAPSLAAYVSRHTERTIPEDYAVAFLPYDWTINRVRAAGDVREE